MAAWRRVVPWLVALIAAALAFSVVTLVDFSWYISEALSPHITIDDSMSVSTESFAPMTLAQAVVPALISCTFLVLIGLGMLQLVRRRGPALFAVLAGPLAAFSWEVEDALYTYFVLLSPGETMAASEPVVWIGHGVIMLVPAFVAATVVMRTARRRGRRSGQPRPASA